MLFLQTKRASLSTYTIVPSLQSSFEAGYSVIMYSRCRSKSTTHSS